MKAKKHGSLLQSLLLLSFLLNACSSQPAVPVDLLPTATASQTPPPTATVIPSPTISPEVIAMQEQIAGDTKNFTLNTEGKLEYKGVTYNGLTYGEDKNWHLTLADGTEVTLTPDEVSMSDENGFSPDGYRYDEEKGVFDVAYTIEQLAKMKPNEIAALAPDTSVEGYTNGGISTMKGKMNLVKYYDAKGELASVYDLTTGLFETPEQAGIIELDLTDGNKREMLAFYDEQELVDYLSANSQWQTGDRMSFMDKVWRGEKSKSYVDWIKKIPGQTWKFDIANPWEGESFVWLSLDDLGSTGGALVTFLDTDGEFDSVYVDAEVTELTNRLESAQFTEPIKE